MVDIAERPEAVIRFAKPERDFGAVAKVEAASFPSIAGKEWWLTLLGRPTARLIVAEFGGQIIGFACGEAWGRIIIVPYFAVAPGWQRCGTGSALLEFFHRTAVKFEWRSVATIVGDHDLQTHLFLKSNGFMARGIDKTSKNWTYQFTKQAGSPSPPPSKRRQLAFT